MGEQKSLEERSNVKYHEKLLRSKGNGSLFWGIEYNAICRTVESSFYNTMPLLFRLVLITLGDIQSQTLRVQIQLVPSASFLQDLGNGSRILDSLQINI
jgi:hypothetical protein